MPQRRRAAQLAIDALYNATHASVEDDENSIHVNVSDNELPEFAVAALDAIEELPDDEDPSEDDEVPVLHSGEREWREIRSRQQDAPGRLARIH